MRTMFMHLGGSQEDVVEVQRLVDSPIWVDTHINMTFLNYDI